MARVPQRSAALAAAGLDALEALVDQLGVAGGALEGFFDARTEPVRETLARAVGRAAFVLAAAHEGLAEEPLEEAFARFFPGAWEARDGARAAGIVLLTLRRTAAISNGDFGPEEIGSVYEGTLGVLVERATELTVVVASQRPAGGAATEIAVKLEALVRVPGTDRCGKLAAAGLSLEPRTIRAIAAARDLDALARAFSVGRRARARLVPSGRALVRSTAGRRSSGSHYTPRALADRVVGLALGPLVASGASSGEILALRVCDPSLGTGAFLVSTCRFLAERLLAAEGTRPSEATRRAARRRVAESCLFGVDRDAVAVEIAALALWLAVGDRALPLDFMGGRLAVGESLLGPPAALTSKVTTPPKAARARAQTTVARASVSPAPSAPRSAASVDWCATFSPVVVERGGFDAFVGNPPWISYVGRAAQPLAPPLRGAYGAFESFSGYRNLQGLFVERSAALLRPGGRLGLLLPSSMSELSGYAPTRRAHDRLCEPDATLADLGDAGFEGVFQPCMVLASTRRASPLYDVPERAWPIERPDLDALALALIEKLSLEPLPARLFGERGLQSMGDDTTHLAGCPDERHTVPLRSGADIEAFRLRRPSQFADPGWFGSRLRSAAQWERVRFVVRQTARAPLAALSDGVAFRNSLLAGFEDADYPATFLVAYLNSTPIRWLHYVRHRDARHGMPQLKVQHLRRTPRPPSPALVEELSRLGAELSSRASGVDAAAQEALDARVAVAFRLSDAERERITQVVPALGLPS